MRTRTSWGSRFIAGITVFFSVRTVDRADRNWSSKAQSFRSSKVSNVKCGSWIRKRTSSLVGRLCRALDHARCDDRLYSYQEDVERAHRSRLRPLRVCKVSSAIGHVVGRSTLSQCKIRKHLRRRSQVM